MEQRDQSEFNMAVSYLNRLNGLFYICDEASMTLDINQWFQSLVALFRELSTEMKSTEIETKNKEIKSIFEDVNSAVSKANKSGQMEVNPDLYWKIHEFELFIRGILKSSGLQQKMKDPAFEALK